MARQPAPSARRLRLVWIGLLILALIALTLYWVRSTGPGPQSTNLRGMGGLPTPVTAVALEMGQVDRSLRTLGTVTARSTIVVRSRVDGPLEALHFQDGQAVAAGDVLAVIDPRPYRIQLEQALGQQAQHAAQLANAERDLARYRQLIAQDSVARQQLDAAQAQVDELRGQARIDRAAVDDARLQLGYTEIKAPVAGHLGLRRVDVGNMVHASDADGLVVLTQDQPIDVLFAIAQPNLPALLAARQVQTDLPVDLRLTADAPVLASGTLVAMDNQIDVDTGTVRLKARFDNAERTLFPNQFVQVRVRLGVERGLVLPLAAVQHGADGAFVYRVGADRRVERVPVEAGVDDGDQLVIHSDRLQAGDRIVVEGTDRLRDGAVVELVEDTGQADEAAGPPDPAAQPDPDAAASAPPPASATQRSPRRGRGS